MAFTRPIHPLKVETVTNIKVDYSDLENYITEITGKKICIPALLESENDSVHEVEVGIHPEWVDDEDKEEANAFLSGDAKDCPRYGFTALLEVMCDNFLLEKGNYLINVSW